MLLRRVSATSEFSNLHPHDQENVLATIEAIQLAADKWRSRRHGHLVSANGSPEVAEPEMASHSEHDFMSCDEVADLLGVPGLRARQLSVSGLGHHKGGGSWGVERARVLAVGVRRARDREAWDPCTDPPPE